MNWMKLTTGGALLLGLMVASPASAQKSKLLVQDLIAQGVQPHEAAVMSSAACQEFAKRTGLDVLCGEDIRNMMRFSAMNAAFDACNDEKCYASMGKAMKARYVVSGTVSRLGNEFILSLSMFDTEKNEPVGRGEVKAESLEKLHNQVAEAASSIKTR
jgi:TolB-like protein